MTPEAIELAIRSTAVQAVQSMRTRCYNDTPIVDALTGPQAQVCAKLIEGAIQSHLETLTKREKQPGAWPDRSKAPRVRGRYAAK